MKKISLILALLLCLVPVLASCGANSSAEKAVKTAIEVKYGDGDADVEDYWAVAYNYNLDILDLLTDKEEASDYKESIRDARKSVKESLNMFGKDFQDELEDEGIDKWDFDYEILYCDVYEKGDTFDAAVENFGYANTDIEDKIEAVAKVGVLMTMESKKGKEVAHESNTTTYVCYKIDGKWYVRG